MATNLEQRGAENQGIYGFMIGDIRKLKKEKCVFCHRNIATIKCAGPNCVKMFDLICGRQHDCLILVNKFKAYCPAHIVGIDDDPTLHDIDDECVGCHKGMGEYNKLTSIPSCCEENEIWHRKCLQMAAYFDSVKKHEGKDSVICSNFIGECKRKLIAHGIYFPEIVWRPAKYDPCKKCNAEMVHKTSFKAQNGDILCFNCGSKDKRAIRLAERDPKEDYPVQSSRESSLTSNESNTSGRDQSSRESSYDPPSNDPE